MSLEKKKAKIKIFLFGDSYEALSLLPLRISAAVPDSPGRVSSQRRSGDT
jgi:hypothetical protein